MLTQLKSASSDAKIRTLGSLGFDSFKSLLSELCAVEDIHSAIFEDNLVFTNTHPAIILDDNGESYLWYEFDSSWHSSKKLGRKHTHQVLYLHAQLVKYLKSFIEQHMDELDGIIEISLQGSLSKYRPIRQCCTFIGNQLVLECELLNVNSDLLIKSVLKPRLMDSDLSIKVMSMLYFSELDPSSIVNLCNDVFLVATTWLQSSSSILKRTCIYVVYKLINSPQLSLYLNELIERNILSIINLIEYQFTLPIIIYAMNNNILHSKIIAKIAHECIYTNFNIFLLIMTRLNFFSIGTSIKPFINFYLFLSYTLESTPVGLCLFSKSLFINSFLYRFDEYSHHIQSILNSYDNKLPDIDKSVTIIPNNDAIPFINHNPDDLLIRFHCVKPTTDVFVPSLKMQQSYIYNKFEIVGDLSDLNQENTADTDYNGSIDLKDPVQYLMFICHFNITEITQFNCRLNLDWESPFLPSVIDVNNVNDPDDEDFKLNIYKYLQSVPSSSSVPENFSEMLIRMAIDHDDVYFLYCLSICTLSRELTINEQSRICYMLNNTTNKYAANMVLCDMFMSNIIKIKHITILQYSVSQLLQQVPNGMCDGAYFDYSLVLPTYETSMVFMGLKVIDTFLENLHNECRTANDVELLNLVIETSSSIMKDALTNSTGIQFIKRQLGYINETLQKYSSVSTIKIIKSILESTKTMKKIEIKHLKGMDRLLIDLIKYSSNKELIQILQDNDLNEYENYEDLKKVMGNWYGLMCKKCGIKLNNRRKKPKIEPAAKSRIKKGKVISIKPSSSVLEFDDITSSLLEFDDISD